MACPKLWNVELLLTGGELVTFLATEIRQQQYFRFGQEFHLIIIRHGSILLSPNRRPEQTLQDFFATGNMAFADAFKAGVGIDPGKRAHHMFLRSGLTDDQINHTYGFVYDREAVGPGASQDHRKIQEVALRFYEKPWDVDRHRDSGASLGRYSRPLMGHAATTMHRHQTSYHLRSRASNKGSYTQEPSKEENFPAEDGYEYNNWDDSSSTWQQCSAKELHEWEEESDLETFLGRRV